MAAEWGGVQRMAVECIRGFEFLGDADARPVAGQAMDWPLSREEKVGQVMRLYDRDLRIASSLLQVSDSDGEASQNDTCESGMLCAEPFLERREHATRPFHFSEVSTMTSSAAASSAVPSSAGDIVAAEEAVDHLRRAVQEAQQALGALTGTAPRGPTCQDSDQEVRKHSLTAPASPNPGRRSPMRLRRECLPDANSHRRQRSRRMSEPAPIAYQDDSDTAVEADCEDTEQPLTRAMPRYDSRKRTRRPPAGSERRAVRKEPPALVKPLMSLETFIGEALPRCDNLLSPRSRENRAKSCGSRPVGLSWRRA